MANKEMINTRLIETKKPTSKGNPVTHCPGCHGMNIYADSQSAIACDDCGY